MRIRLRIPAQALPRLDVNNQGEIAWDSPHRGATDGILRGPVGGGGLSGGLSGTKLYNPGHLTIAR